MHRLQQHILHRLILNSVQRYADLKPTEVEGNLFMYHLRCLLKEGWVEKRADGRYQLSSEGKAYADRLSLKSFAPRIQPRIVTLMAVERDGQWLMYKRKRQPLINMVGFPYGKIHLGETVGEAAARELAEKTGLTASLKHVGDGYANTFEDDNAVSQILFHLFYGLNPSGELAAETETGVPMWLDEGQTNNHFLIPNVPEIIKQIKSGPERFFIELNHSVGSS